MSIDFVSDKHIPFSKIKTFNYNGVTVDEIDEDGNVILTDGTNYMWAVPNADFEIFNFKNRYKPEFESMLHYEGVVFIRYAGNDPTIIIKAIETFFDVTLVSEYEDEYDELITKRQAALKIVPKS
jgi:hypothetical protein